MADDLEVEHLANQYGRVGKANRYKRGEMSDILRPVFSGMPKDRLVRLRDGFKVKSQQQGGERYVDLWWFVNKTIKGR